MKSRGKVGNDQLDKLEPAELSPDSPSPVHDVFHEIRRDRKYAARKLITYLRQGGSAEEMIRRARQLVFFKGKDSRDYKFSSAVLEDFYHLGPRYRNLFLAASVYKLHGAEDRDNGLVQRIRGAFG